MEIELHQLELRYESVRSRHPRRERQLLASLAEVGQQLPVVVVAAEGRFVLIDGYKRVRALRRLARDSVRATPWELEEAEALLLERLMRTGSTEGPLEQGWLLKALVGRFGLSQQELARRFDKSQSWVSRRLSLVEELPEKIQEKVRHGEVAAHAAMKCLVPMARANAEAAEQLTAAIAPLKLSTRQVVALWGGWQAQAEAAQPRPVEQLLGDFEALAGVARRARKRLAQGLWTGLAPAEREESRRCAEQARADCAGLWARYDKEAADARPEHAGGDPRAA